MKNNSSNFPVSSVSGNIFIPTNYISDTVTGAVDYIIGLANKNNLQITITVAKKLIESYKKHNIEIRKDFSDVYKYAITIYYSQNSTQKEVDTACSDLQFAILELEVGNEEKQKKLRKILS